MFRKAAASLFIFLAFASAASAHAMLRGARPGVGSTVRSAPRAVELDFSEAIVPSFSGLALRDPSGGPVATGRASRGAQAETLVVPIAGELAPGTYTVTWHAVSVDTHRTQGSFRFTIEK